MNSRFSIINSIAESGYSQVFHAFDEQRHIEVALKRARRGVNYAEQQLINEAAILRLLSSSCPGVPALIDTGEDEEGRWLAREWIQGETLETRLERQALSAEESVRVFSELTSIIATLHHQGYAHADLNERNVLLAHDGSVHLIDFGNACPLASIQPNTTGSVHHMAPELFDHQPPGIRTDQYALGVVGYRMAAGRYPFDGETKAQIITAHLRQKPVPFEHPLAAKIMTLLERPRLSAEIADTHCSPH